MENDNKNHQVKGYLLAVGFSLFAITLPNYADSIESLPIKPGTPLMQLASNNSFIFNPRTLQWRALNENGKVIRTGHGSAGRGYCPDIKRSCRTPTGVHYIMSKGGPECRSTRYPVGRGGAPMPYCMFFSKLYAVHGSYEVPNYNASHGCIRVEPGDARWLVNFLHIGSKVVVKPY